MKQFLLFTFTEQNFRFEDCPNGGWSDFSGDFRTVEEACKKAVYQRERQYHTDYQIVDSSTMKIIERGRIEYLIKENE